MTIQEAKNHGKTELTSSPTPALDTEVLLQHITGFDKANLLLNRDFELLPVQETFFRKAIEQRKTGFPIAYITGHKEFFGYDFAVSPAVLIPKPDTETLVEQAVAFLRGWYAHHRGGAPAVCDMCAGSGCVGLSVLRTLADAGNVPPERLPRITFADISADALAVARTNAARLLGGADESRGGALPITTGKSQTGAGALPSTADESQTSAGALPSTAGKSQPSAGVPQIPARTPPLIELVSFVQSDLFAAVAGAFDAIVTNPPYVPHDEARALLTDGRGEPILALDGDVDGAGGDAGSRDGLAIIRRLVPEAAARLNAGGALLMETGEYNAEAAAALAQSAGFRAVHIVRDLAGQLRVVIGAKS